MVYFPKWEDETLGKINELTDVWALVSILNPSFAVISFSFKYQVILAFGKASTKHSNLAGWSWTAIESFGFDKNDGFPNN